VTDIIFTIILGTHIIRRRRVTITGNPIHTYDSGSGNPIHTFIHMIGVTSALGVCVQYGIPVIDGCEKQVPSHKSI